MFLTSAIAMFLTSKSSLLFLNLNKELILICSPHQADDIGTSVI